jgi:hypothetical protein
VAVGKLEAAKASKEAAAAETAAASAAPVAAPPAAAASSKTAKGAATSKAGSKPDKSVARKDQPSSKAASSSAQKSSASFLSGKSSSKAPSKASGGGSGGVFPAEGPGHKHPIDLEGHLKAALAKFVPQNAEGLCVARHAGGMEGVLLKEVTYDAKGAAAATEPLKDASCCAACAKVPACEFWVRDTGGPSCWLMKGFRGLLVEPNRRSAFSGAWATKKRLELGLGKALLPGTPGIGEIMPPSMQASSGGGGSGSGGGRASGGQRFAVDLVPGEGQRSSGGSGGGSSSSSSSISKSGGGVSSGNKGDKGKTKGPTSIVGSVLKAIKGKGTAAGVHKESRKKGK